MKLNEYVKNQISGLNKLTKNVDIFCKDLNLYKMKLLVAKDEPNNDYSIMLEVSIELLENNKQKIADSIAIILKEVKNENYDCEEIKTEDGSISVNMFNTDNITLLQVFKNNKIMYQYVDGIPDLKDFMLASKAVKEYNLSDSTIRRAIHDGRFINGVDCFKEGHDWYVKISKLDEKYGGRK